MSAKPLLAVLLGVALVGACAKTVQDTKDDQTTTTRVQAALLSAPAVDGMRIKVQTLQGVVILSGTVKSREQEQQAINAARRVVGVKDVKSNLQIAP